MGNKCTKYAFLICVFLMGLCGPGRLRAGEPKITVGEILARHLDGYAQREARAAAKTRASEWAAHYVVKMGGHGMADGRGVLISDRRKLAFGLRFPVSEYPGERFVFDGQKWQTARRTTDQRSGQADMVLDNSEILTEGLFGSVLTTAWPLFDLETRKPTLKYDGLKKIDGVELHRVSYTPKTSNNGMQIFLFFDPKTMQHVKTIYYLEIQPGTQNLNYTRAADVRYTPNSRYKLEEDFSDFKNFQGYSLPTRWKVRYTWEPSSRGGETMIDWELAMQRVLTNNEVDPKTFTVEGAEQSLVR